MKSYDICVAGFGAWGASTAWALARGGLRVLALDPFDPPHAHGSHTGRTRLARRSAHEGEAYTPITKRAFALWEQLQTEHDVVLLERTGALMLDQPDGGLVAPSRATLESGGWGYEQLGHAAMAERWPDVRLLDGEVGLYEPGAATLDAPAAIRTLGTAARAAGTEVRTGRRLVRWEPCGAGLQIWTDRGDRVRVDRLVACVGNQAPDLLATGWPLEVERQVLVTYRSPRSLPSIFAVDPQLGERSGFYGCPEPGDTYKVALHHDGDTGPVATLRPHVDARDLAQVAKVVGRRLPQLTDVVDAAVCTYTNTPAHDWILDRHPEHPNVVIGTGDSGRGFRYAPAIGEILADAVTDTTPPPAFLRADRFHA